MELEEAGDLGPWASESPGPWQEARPSKRRRGPATETGSPGPWSPAATQTTSDIHQDISDSPGPWENDKVQPVNLNFELGSIGAALLDVSTRAEEARAQSKYERGGMDPDQVMNRYHSAGNYCRCQGGSCYRRVKVAALLATAKAFWTLPGGERGHLLRTLYYAAAGASPASSLESAKDRPQAHWQLCSQTVCLAVFARLLGTTQASMWKSIYNTPDMRLERAPTPASQSRLVDFFFYELYNSAAEPLPDNPAGRLKPGHSVGAPACPTSEFLIAAQLVRLD